MKKVVSILLLLLFFSPFILKVCIVATWFLHYDYILENICVQKDEVVNTCNGKCHLSKNLQKVDESTSTSDKAPDFNTSKLEYNPFIANIDIELNALQANLLPIPNTYFIDGVSQFSPKLDIPPPRFC